MPTVDEFESSEWTDRKPYVGLVADNTGGGCFTTMNQVNYQMGMFGQKIPTFSGRLIFHGMVPGTT